MPNFEKKDISFVLPMYNEAEAIEDTLKEIVSVAGHLSDNYEIIVVDDGSTDNSSAIADNISKKNSKIITIHLEKNTKFGGALKEGLKKATKEIVIYTDSDLPVGLEDIKKTVPMLDSADIVTATSMVKKGENIKRKIISAVYNLLIQVLFRTGIRDINSGYKIYKREILQDMDLRSNSPFIDVEIFIKAKKKNAKIIEYPIIFRPRKKGVSKISRVPVIIQTFLDMLICRFTL